MLTGFALRRKLGGLGEQGCSSGMRRWPRLRGGPAMRENRRRHCFQRTMKIDLNLKTYF
jgi:hypothetical protein